MSQPVGVFGGQTLSQAYQDLFIDDYPIPDGDVVAAFHECYFGLNDVSHQSRAVNALKVVSHQRRSPLLAFILTIVPSLTRENVALLATPSPFEPEVSRVRTSHEQPALDISNGALSATAVQSSITLGTHCNSSEPKTIQKSVSSTSSTSDDGTIEPVPMDTTSDVLDSKAPESCSFSAITSEDSSSDESVDSTSENFNRDASTGGKVHDGEYWRCERCNEQLLNGKCPNDHPISPCILCTQDFDPRDCQSTCDRCHKELKEPCSVCGGVGYDGDEDCAENVHMAWDARDSVWRYMTCFWEVPWNDYMVGSCYCWNTRKSSRRRTFFAIKASKDPEHMRAYVDSSDSESSESEGESDLEGFIDDEDDVGLKPGGHMGPLRPLGILHPFATDENADDEMVEEMDEVNR